MSKKRKPLKRQIWDCKHVKSVRVWILLYKGESAGKVIANWSDNPAGSVVTCATIAYFGPLADLREATGEAGGCGHDKFSAAFVDGLERSNFRDLLPDVSTYGISGAGETKVRKWFEALGYVVIEALG